MGSPGSPADYDAAMSADVQFLKTASAVEKRLPLIGRLPAVRIKAWLSKLKQSTSNLTWKRNRNLYARLLLEQLRAGCLEVPFNALPPDGPLPTLPTYLTYRFISPPLQRFSQCNGSEDCSPMSMRPRSAGSPPGHSSWSAMRTSAPMPLLNQNSSSSTSSTAAAAATVLQPGHFSALSPIRCGQLPRQQGGDGGQVQQSWPDEAGILPGGIDRSKHASGKRPSPVRGYGSSCSPAGVSAAGAAIARLAGIGGSPVRMRPGGVVSPGAALRPGSPGAAGLLDAAVAIAAELEGGKVDAALLDSRLRYAEDKLLQQEAELVRLQGQAAAARRRVKAVTAATLGELVERYSSTAAAWGSATTQRPGSPNRHPTYAESVYSPMWQLISSVQQVLDCCDQQDMQWQQEKLGAAAAARFDADQQAQQAQQAEYEQQQATAAAVRLGGASTAATSPAGDAGSLEQQVMLKLKKLVVQLQKQAEQLAGLLQSSKDAATAAAAGSGVSAAEVAAAAAQAMRPMLKLIKHMAAKDKVKLQRDLVAAADAAALAVNAAGFSKSDSHSRRRHSSSSLSGSSGAGSSDNFHDSVEISSNDSSSDSSCEQEHRRNRRQQKLARQHRQEQQCQHARISRLQAAQQIVLELEEATNKLSGQLHDGKRRLADASGYMQVNSPAGAALPGAMAAHEHGLAAAAVAGITASMAAATSTYSARMRELKQQLKVVSKATTAAAPVPAAGATAVRGENGSKHSSEFKQRSAMGASSRAVSFRQHDTLETTGLGSKAGDRALAGTFGSRNTSPSGQFNSISHYLIGGAAASSSPVTSPLVAAAASSTLGSKAAFASSLLSGAQPSSAAGLLSAASTSVGGADAVHQRLANLSRQASRISERASVLLGDHTTPEPGAASSSSLLGRAASPSLPPTSLLGGANSSLLSGARSASFTATGAGAGFGSSLLGGYSASTAAGKLSGGADLQSTSGRMAVGSSLLTAGGVGGIRASSPSLLAGGGSLLGGSGSSSLAAMSSKLNTLSQRWGAASSSFRI